MLEKKPCRAEDKVSQDEWIRVILAIALGVLFLPRLLRDRRPGKGGKAGPARKNSRLAQFAMLFVGFGAIAVFILWQYTDFIAGSAF